MNASRSRLRVWSRIACALLLAGCAPAPEDAEPALFAPSYPPGPYEIAVGGVLPDLRFEGVDPTGRAETVRLRRYVDPARSAPRLLLIQISGGQWCGTCVAMAAHLDAIVDDAAKGRVDRLDLLLRSRDNAAPEAIRDGGSWRAALSPRADAAVAVDPEGVLFEAFDEGEARLPAFAIVDERSMVLTRVLANPGPAELRGALAGALAEAGGGAPPPPDEEPLVDGLFTAIEWEMFQAMGAVPGAPPPDPTNAVADAPAAAQLGEALFFDPGLSPSGAVSCASCHKPELGFADDRPRGVGVAEGTRRAPSIALAAHSRWQGWDGGADSLWAQALGPLESPIEFGSSRVFVARRVIDAHAEAYRAAFPDSALPGAAGWPASGMPGDPAYDELPKEQARAITQVFVNVGKALAAYERTLRVVPNRFDAYVAGDRGALSDEEKYGLQLFARSGCMQCHWGPRLTDDAFHNTHAGATADEGRLSGLARWSESEFRADGTWSDGASSRPALHGVASNETLGQFKTPSLRGVAEASYFGHDGSVSALSTVTEGYGKGGAGAVGAADPWLVGFGETTQWGLVPFLRTLRATSP